VHNPGDRQLYVGDHRPENLEPIRGKYDYREPTPLEVLPIPQALVGGQKQIKLHFGSA
jgi:hypothetical protein